jgi:ferredoxin
MKKNIHGWNIRIDRQLCIGAASCMAVAPHAFELDDEAKAVLMDSASQETKDAIMDAARVCPVAAIIIEEAKTGKRVYPK